MSSLLEELENDDLVEVESAGGSELGSLITTALSSLAAHEPSSSHQSAAPSSSLGDVVILEDSDCEEVADEIEEVEEVAVEASDDDDAEHPGQRPPHGAAAESPVAHSPPKRARGRPRGRPVPRVEREVAVQNAEAMLADLVIHVYSELYSTHYFFIIPLLLRPACCSPRKALDFLRPFVRADETLEALVQCRRESSGATGCCGASRTPYAARRC